MQGTGTSSLRQPLQSSSGRLGRIASLRAQIATPALHPKETQFNPEGRHLICPKFTSKLKYCFRRLSSLCIWARPLMVARKTMEKRNFVKAEVPRGSVQRRAIWVPQRYRKTGRKEGRERARREEGTSKNCPTLPDDDCSGLTQARKRNPRK